FTIDTPRPYSWSIYFCCLFAACLLLICLALVGWLGLSIVTKPQPISVPMIDQAEMQRWSATFEEIAHMTMGEDASPWWMLVAEGDIKDRDTDTIIAVG